MRKMHAIPPRDSPSAFIFTGAPRTASNSRTRSTTRAACSRLRSTLAESRAVSRIIHTHICVCIFSAGLGALFVATTFRSPRRDAGQGAGPRRRADRECRWSRCTRRRPSCTRQRLQFGGGFSVARVRASPHCTHKVESPRVKIDVRAKHKILCGAQYCRCTGRATLFDLPALREVAAARGHVEEPDLGGRRLQCIGCALPKDAERRHFSKSPREDMALLIVTPALVEPSHGCHPRQRVWYELDYESMYRQKPKRRQ